MILTGPNVIGYSSNVQLFYVLTILFYFVQAWDDLPGYWWPDDLLSLCPDELYLVSTVNLALRLIFLSVNNSSMVSQSLLSYGQLIVQKIGYDPVMGESP